MERIYLDHAATTPLDKDVLDAMLPYLTTEFGNADSPHAVGRKAMMAVDRARDTVAELVNAKPNEIYFTSGGTEADNWAIIGGAYAQRALGKNRIIVSAIEHHAVKEAAEKLKKEGFDVVVLPMNEGGRVALSDVKAALTPDTGLVAVMAVNNETGVVQPVKEIAALARENGSLFFCDAVQAAPYMPLNVKDWGVDMLSFSSHKFYGPKGCGVLYIRSGVKMDRLIVGGEQERGLRGGTTNIPAVVGLAAAYAKNVATMSASNEKIQRLRETFLSEILTLDNVHINGDSENALAAVLNLRFDGVRNEDLLYKLDLEGVCIAAGSACASASVKPSHVLTAMGLTEEKARASVRVSFGKNNTEEEIRRAAALMKAAVETLRKF
ncbi:MAG: cysteine desulfurase [Clostridia bacterium]|nr:cysteine desulfurase [Clostridia bacterium]